MKKTQQKLLAMALVALLGANMAQPMVAHANEPAPTAQHEEIPAWLAAASQNNGVQFGTNVQVAFEPQIDE